MPTSMTVNCRHHGCRRQVRVDNPYGPWCHDHRAESALVMSGQVDETGWLPPSQRTVAGLVYRPITYAANLMHRVLGIQEEVAGQILEATEEWSRGRDLTVPSQAVALQGEAAGEVASIMERNGMSRQRIDVIEVYGLNRKVPQTGRTQSAPDVTHTVVMIDRTQSAVIVDPTVAAFAPVYQPDVSVDDQLPSGLTPFGDVPWVGQADEYLGGDSLWWDGYRVVQRS